MQVIYDDNHLIIVSKAPGEIVQGDKTGDATLADSVKAYIKETCAKPGAVFLGTVHRLDRPVGGLVVFARTSKALARMNDLFRTGQVTKTYWAIVPTPAEGTAAALQREPRTLVHWLVRREAQNKTYAHDHEVPGSQRAELDYREIARSDRYSLLEVHLHTGRHHQIRCQLAAIGLPIHGDLKYGAPRSLPDGSISLLARHIAFDHPVSHKHIEAEAPVPESRLWQALAAGIRE